MTVVDIHYVWRIVVAFKCGSVSHLTMSVFVRRPTRVGTTNPEVCLLLVFFATVLQEGTKVQTGWH